MTTLSSRAMKLAHIMRNDKPDYPWSDALRRAWWFVHFRKQLSTGFATFSFYKKDGSIREAKGTLFMPLIPADKWPKESKVESQKSKASSFTFFDLDKQEWRSFSISNFIGFVTLYEVKESKEKEPKRK